MKTVTVCCFLLVSTLLLAKEGTKPCGRKDAILAEQEASSLRSWTEVYKSYRHFRQCDDGAIGEGYSDSIARLVSEKWSSADQLDRLASHDRGFRSFVLHHIDELMSPSQAETIRNNAETHCPSRAGKLCKQIAARLKEVSAGAGDSTPDSQKR
jgi:hypothetical protein